MESLVGAIAALVLSVGYTEMKTRKHQKEYEEHVERVNVMEQNLGRNMIASMMPMSKAIRELQETVGMR